MFRNIKTYFDKKSNVFSFGISVTVKQLRGHLRTILIYVRSK